MAPGQDEGLPSAAEMQFYGLYRERIRDEDSLIYQRLSWLTTAQTIMFSFTAIAFFRGGPGHLDRSGTVIMCVLGVLLCLVSLGGVWAAVRTIEEVRRDYEHRRPNPHPLLPPLAGLSRTHQVGRLIPFAIPPLFIAAWLAILAIAMG